MPHALATRDLERQKLLELNGRCTGFYAFAVAPLVVLNLALEAWFVPVWQFRALTGAMVLTGLCWGAAHLLNRRGRLVLSVGLTVGAAIAFDAFALAMRQDVFAAAMMASLGMAFYGWVIVPQLAVAATVLIFGTSVLMRLCGYLGMLPAAAPSPGLAALLDLTLLGCVLPCLLYLLQRRLRISELPYHTLARQHEWLEAVVRQVPMPLVLFDSGTGEVQVASQAAESILGAQDGAQSSGEPEARSGRSMLNDALERAAHGHCFEAEELTWTAPAGERMTGLCVSRMLPAMPGHEATGLVAVLDVTGLKTAQRELEAALDLREEFLTVASHELRTPLTALTLQLESMARDVARRPERVGPQWAEQRVVLLRRQCARLTGLVHGLLDGARIQAGRLELAAEPLDLREVATEVLSRFGHEAAAAGCELRLDAHSAAEGIWDRACLEHVLSNLVSNAIKYGAGRPVVVSVRESEGGVHLEVRDHGVGIAAQDQPRLFKRFERLHRSPEYRGFGLGLWIVRSAVERMDGTIEVESEPGRGSRFVVHLPTARRAAMQAEIQAA